MTMVPELSCTSDLQLGSSRSDRSSDANDTVTCCADGLQKCLWGLGIGRLPAAVTFALGLRRRGPGRGACSEHEFKQRIEFLGQVNLFNAFRRPISRYWLPRELRGVCWEAGQVILKHGQQLTEFNIVAEGWAEVQVEGPPGCISTQLLWPGDYFGERVLQTGGGTVVRSPAKVVAGPTLVTLAMSPEEFEDFGIRQHLQFPKRRALSRCVVQKAAETTVKSDNERKFLAQALKSNFNLRSLVDLQEHLVEQMCDAACRQEVPIGTKIVQRGEYGGMFYIVESGSFELRVDVGESPTSPRHTDALARAKSGALGEQRQAASPWASNSETLRRMQRKERFLQKLAHTKDLDFEDDDDISRMKKQSSLRNVRREKTAGFTLPSTAEGQALARCQTMGHSHSMVPGDGDSDGESPMNEVRLPSRVMQFMSCESLSTVAASPSDDSATGMDSTASLRHIMPDPSPLRSPSGLNGDFRRTASNPTLLCTLSPRSAAAAAKDMLSGQSRPAKVLGVRRRGECFGELALLYHAPRTSDAVAREDSVVWCVSQAQFRRIMRSTQQDKVEQIVTKLGNVDLLQGLLMHERLELAQNFLTAKFKRGDWLIHKGEKQEVWYVIIEGECTMTQPNGEGDGEELATLSSPQHFGERALLRQRPSEFSVRVSSDEVECLLLDGPTFRRLAGHLTPEDFRHAAEDDLMEFAKYKKERSARKLKGFLSKLDLDSANSGRTPRKARRAGSVLLGPGMDDEVHLDPNSAHRTLERRAILGRGAFGLVTLESDPTSGQDFALKTVYKKHIVQNRLQEAIRLERQILTMVDSPFIVRLHATFRDSAYLYFLFEPLLGGELHARMCREPSRFRDIRVYRFLLGCVTLAFEHLHDRSIVYRDLKPENVLLDTSGYIKLCDMGFAKFVFGKTATLCGTPEYMAPEVILHGGYDRMVDWWAIGILAYEFVCGCTPFIDEEDENCRPEVIFANILSTREQDLELPPKMLPATADFVDSLLRFSPGKRLGNGGAAQVKNSPFFGNYLDFQALAQQKITPAYVPRVKTAAELARTLNKGVPVPSDGGACPDDTDDDWDDVF
eukprot:CAMPEP_0170214076 /NCGR_PEP_ID=MMETSP0116_2-20130129/6664_1 /TAXON_ID=400756 /ORGANISM="Durinskia baltica, Strain CSIRO CS-38" /LENGTH=1073 /DNA_ID=CAMNT_0010464631 /DNA_START=33 /DNA_END=3255 /DNA_ORIENTATION=-